MTIQDRYAAAIRSSNLSHTDERSKSGGTSYDDVDVLGAMALAHRDLSEGRTWSRGQQVPIPKAELAVPLERLFMGDNYAAQEIIEIMVEWLRGKAPAMHLKLTTVQCADMAKACLAWHRDHICKACGGQGRGSVTTHGWFGGAICKPCRGSGHIPFEKQFRHDQRDLARWLLAEVEREQGRAGPAAMRKIAARMEL
jgi:hypothetical protein